ncbi:MAG: Dolichyl-phosphate-mannose-protein mannosyltransferase [Gaiellales bacterium]|nr:Dolichyl-phosphate-mannose-protein mannosyltransferase [Gaiellales bacterium]
MAAISHSPRSHRPVLIVCAVAAAYVVTRIALTWRFPWFVDETIFASFAKEVHGDVIGQFFVAQNDQKGLLPSWMGAGLIALGIEPVTAMRLLSAAGAAVAAACGGLVVRRLYGGREGLATAALIALGPYFLVTASVGIYDAMVTGLVTVGVLLSILIARRPRFATALLLAGVLGAGGLTKPTAWASAAVLPFTLLLFDFRSPDLRQRLLRWGGLSAMAVALGYAIASIARLTPLYDAPAPPLCAPGTQLPAPCSQAQRDLGQIVDHAGDVATNVIWIAAELIGYLTLPGVALAVVGAIVAWRRRRAAAAILGFWAIAVLISVALFSMTANPRYFATAIVPLTGFVAIGGLAVWDALLRRWSGRPRLARGLACALALAALVPAASFETSVLAHPAHAPYPGFDEQQYVTGHGALSPLTALAREIERRGGPYPVRIDAGPYPRKVYSDIGPWGLDLLLNGATVGARRRFDVIARGTSAQRAAARYLVSDGERGDAPPQPGYRLILRIQRPERGAVLRLYERPAAR